MNTSHEDEPLVALSSLSVRQKAQIIAFSFDNGNGESIQKMGLIPGEQLEIMRLPPQGEPIEIKVRGYFISLSKQEASHIKVKVLKNPS